MNKLHEDYKLQYLAYHISQTIFVHAIDALSEEVFQNTFDYHDITEGHIYDRNVNVIGTGIFEGPILMQCLISEIKNDFLYSQVY